LVHFTLHIISRYYCALLLALGIAAILASPASSQVIKATVEVSADRLPIEEKQYIEGLCPSLTALINQYPWVKDGYKYEFPISLNLYFDKYSHSGTFRRYTAGIMLGLRNGIQLRDRRWDFRYTRDFPLHLGEPYDPLTGMIEFYIWMCLGLEADRYNPLAGQPYYEKARVTAEKARFEIDYYSGWDVRRELPRDFLADTYRDIRTAAYHFEAGIYFLGKDDRETARSHLIRCAELAMNGSPELMELHRDDHIIRFIDADRLVAALVELEAWEVLKKMEKWDKENPKRYEY